MPAHAAERVDYHGHFKIIKVSPRRTVDGRFMDRLAHRVASVTSVRPARRKAPMARLRMAAMILGPDQVLTWELSSR